jgi:ankyrin repeat protein
MQKGADIRAINIEGNTLFHFAVKGSNIDGIVFCLGEGMEVNQRNNLGQTPFHMAAALVKDRNIFKILFQNNADIHATDPNGGTALHFAATEGNLISIEFCTENGLLPRINDALNDGSTPLDLACIFSRFEVVELLVKKGAFISDKTLRDASNKSDILAFLKAGTTI